MEEDLSSNKFRPCAAGHAELGLSLQVAPNLIAGALTGKEFLIQADGLVGIVATFFEQLDTEMAEALGAEFIEETRASLRYGIEERVPATDIGL